MSHFVVNLSEPEKEEEQQTDAGETADGKNVSKKAGVTGVSQSAGETNVSESPKKRSGCGRILGISAIVLAVLLLFGALAGYFYWQSVKASPQYSLALLVDAGRRGDQKAIDELVDTDAVVDSFMPQVTDKATELYGKNLPPEKLSKVKEFSTPLMPAIKQRARSEVPRVIKEKTDKFESIPYWAIAIGAGYYLDIKPNGDTATVTSKIPERQFELTMKRNGDKWRVVAIKDDALARRIAETIGQELIAISTKEGLKKASEKMNAPGLENIKKKIDDLFK
ncbi:MAG TPA: hypothetical protein VGC97_12980 [Pyrinomonadaceae bacterium]|jgi:hypothetical protein